MKAKIKYLMIACAMLLASCSDLSEEATPIKTNGLDSFYIQAIDGHEYIIFHGYKQGGIIHNENCPCKKGGKDEQ